MRLRPYAVVLSMWALVWAVPAGQTRAPQPPTGVVIDGSVVDAALKPLPGVTVTFLQSTRAVASRVTDERGAFRFEHIQPGAYRVHAELTGFTPVDRELKVAATPGVQHLPLVLMRPGDREGIAVGAGPPAAMPIQPPAQMGQAGRGGGVAGGVVGGVPASQGVTVSGAGPVTDSRAWIVPPTRPWPYPGGESYAHRDPNQFRLTAEDPLSTFGADVDTASYSNVRRFLSSGRLPPPDAVRVEELVNYFRFDYANPTDGRPIGVTTEVGECPWAPTHKLVLVGARARPADRTLEGRNIVLLIDVSGSMAPADKLPLIRTALDMFVDTLGEDDRLAIVTYAGASGIALPSTPASDRRTIHRVIDSLVAGGSTNGGQGLILAYRTARQAFIPGGVNRVILATDGDFNVGLVSRSDLLQLIERERDSGVFLSVFGVGTGNLKDSTMEMLADRGNGHYAYLDTLQEARRVLIREGDATLETVAKDVKFQIEFNPATVTAWKLLGYEDRALAPQAFNDDRKDAGEMGAGHTVTVLYEIVPAGVPYPDGAGDRPAVDPLKYQPAAPRPPVRTTAEYRNELLTVKVRYKLPDADDSQLISVAVRPGGKAPDLPFAAAVAEFGLLLRDGRLPVDRWEALADRLRTMAVPPDRAADRDEFSELVDLAVGLRRLVGK
jgi:Ca-activated chloride channel homolog